MKLEYTRNRKQSRSAKDAKSTQTIKRNTMFLTISISVAQRLLIICTLVNKLVDKPDVIIGYFANAFFNIKDLYDLQIFYKAPVILFMADMIHITGGCHFAWRRGRSEI